MRASVWTRIFAGLLLVTLSFSGVIAFTVHRMHQVQQQLDLISSRYLPLTLGLGELHTLQRNLVQAVADRVQGAEASRLLQRQVRLAHQFRLHEVRRALALVESAARSSLRPHDLQVVDRSRVRLLRLEASFRRHGPLLDRLFSQRVDAPAAGQLGAQLARSEGQLAGAIRRIRNDLRAQMTSAALEVEVDQRSSILTGLILVALALVITLAVSFGVRRTLRPLETLVAGAKRIGLGNYGQRVPVQSQDELGLLAREFNQMAEALQEREGRLIRSERMAAAGVLAAHITHEVRNPLNAIALNTEVLDEDLAAMQSDPRAKDARQLCLAIQREVDRLVAITEEYLRFARLPKPQLERVEINVLVAELLSFFASELRRRQVEVEFDLSPGPTTIAADPNQLRQCLLNLLRNAAEALGEQGGGRIRVVTAWADDGQSLAISVSDDGPGISPDKLGQLFEPFFTTKEGGTGLGLPLARQIIREHGGRLELSSRPAGGTTFTVLLPASPSRDTLEA